MSGRSSGRGSGRGDRGGGGARGGGRGLPGGFGASQGRGDGATRGNRGDGGTRGPRGGGGFGRGGPKLAPEGEIIFNPPGDPASPPSAEVTKAEDKLVAKVKAQPLAGLSMTSKMPPRPGFGTMGRPIVLRANYFQILPDPDLQIFRYNVLVSPELKAARKRKRAFQLLIATAPFLAKTRPAVATDYRSMLITTKELNLGPGQKHRIDYFDEEEAGPNPDRPSIYEFTVTPSTIHSVQELMDYISSADPSTADGGKESVIQALNVAMARKPSSAGNVASVAGLNKFFPIPTGPSMELGGGLVALRGYYSSVRTSTLRLLINVNSITGAFFRPGRLLDLMRQFRDDNGASDVKLNSFLKGVRIEVDHLKTGTGKKRTKVIAGLARVPRYGASSKEVTFDKDGKKITVFDYFAKEHRINLKVGDAPVVNVGNAEHPIYMPPEQCSVLPGQISRKKLSPKQTADMILVACRRPADNARLAVGEGAQALGLDANSVDGPSLFGLRISPKMITVPGRILLPPNVNYGKKNAPLRDGSWNLANLKFNKPARIADWGILQIHLPGGAPTQLPNLRQDFISSLKACGLAVDPPSLLPGPEILPLSRDQSHQENTIGKVFEAIRNKSRVRMLLVVLPEKSQGLYATVKFLGDVKWGLHTLCCVAPTVARQKFPEQYFANVAMKWNLKKGGVNQQIPPEKLGILSTKTMVVGIDVTHPSPDSSESAPSIAGVVASVDNVYAQWPATVRIQEGRKEMVTELEEMIISRLQLWKTHNSGKLPERILVYRDGVSEGQYPIVLLQEAPAFDKAIDKLYPPKGQRPKVSIIIVGKRHHTRFYPTTLGDANEKNGNPKNGTVVDRGVTSERNWDFFLQAHTGLQGTARPAHYVVVQDQNKLGADGLEQMTHNLCYLFGRATKAVSICPPAYYADIVCERARMYLSDTFHDASTVTSGPAFNPANSRWTRDVHPELKNTMFYI
ncbi:MAG: hypothetical protein M4579_002632 [Chaenotheca gracillima]|nr:MAG: hypothetical protein M4579_002632 [Chaenotheca gracillima]